MRYKQIFILLLLSVLSELNLRADEVTDSINSSDKNLCDSVVLSNIAPVDSLPVVAQKHWWTELKQWNLDLKDTTVYYPKFLRFCVDTYNWADKTFNSYDPEYVEGTGRRWKAILRSDNWTDSYAFQFEKMPVRMMSEINCNVGFHLSYMAVSVGYTLDFGHIIGNKPSNHKKWDFNFSCALFSVDAYYHDNYDGTVIRRFGEYDNGRWIEYPFTNLKLKTYGIDGYYFFNNRKYSQGAAYNFSKIQKRSAGSLIVGVTVSHNDIDIDFSTLPEKMQEYMLTDKRRFNFDYNDYCFLVGYGYNVVMGKHWLFNVTALPAVGFKHNCYDSVDGRDQFSMNIKGKGALIYNLGDFFAGALGKFSGNWYMANDYQFFNAITSLSLNVGVRF